MENSFGIDKQQFKRALALIALNLFGIFIVYLLRAFITPFLGALIFSVMFTPFMDKLAYQRKWSETAAAICIIVLSFFIILIPILTLSYLLYDKVSEVANDPASLLGIIQLADERFYALFGFELFNDQLIDNVKKLAGDLIPSFLNELVWILGNIAMMYFMLFFLLVQREAIKKEINNYLPFDMNNIGVLAQELKSMTLSNAIGVPLIGVIQGTAAGIGYWIFGLPDPFFWGVITAFVSLLPIVGSTLIWLPAALFIMATGNLWMGIGMLVYGVIVVINIDNVARFIIQKQFADVHPLITVFGVLIGLDLFGLPGLIFGPLMLSYFIIFIKMYRKVYASTA